MFIFLLSVCLPLNSGLTRNKREPQEIPNPGYQLYRYEMCILPGMACALHALTLTHTGDGMIDFSLINSILFIRWILLTEYM